MPQTQMLFINSNQFIPTSNAPFYEQFSVEIS